MLFRKPNSPACQNCIYSAKLEGDQMLCAKRGVVSLYHACRKYRYDPCKRIPPRPKALDFRKYQDVDFSL